MMAEKLKKLLGEEKTLEERIFAVTLVAGFIIVMISTIVTVIERLSPLASISSAIGALIFLLIMVVNYGLKKERLARLLLCYFMNCILIPITFFTCGGIDSGMPLYVLGGLFLIVPTLKGFERTVCFCFSLIVDICMIGISYNFMK